jgi:hypothetical protein
MNKSFRWIERNDLHYRCFTMECDFNETCGACKQEPGAPPDSQWYWTAWTCGMSPNRIDDGTADTLEEAQEKVLQACELIP